MNTKRTERLVHLLVHILSLLPAFWLLLLLLTHHLGVNPVQTLERRSGDIALDWLLASLACTPLRILTGQSLFTRLRKPLGLYAFAYAGLHLLLFLGLDYGWVWREIVKTIAGKPYIWLGLAAFLILLVLALTSTSGWQRRLGKRWKWLHALAYLAGVLAVVHFAMDVKGDLFHLTGDIGGPLRALGVLALLFVIRLHFVREHITQLRGKICFRRKAGPGA